MIYATIIICTAAHAAACSQLTGYKALPVEETFTSVMQCQRSVMFLMPAIPHKTGDTFRIICGGKYARIIGADI